MATYEKILAAVNFGPESGLVCRRAVELAKSCGATLTLLHVVEYVPVDLGNDLVLPQPLEIEELLVERARKRLGELAAGLQGVDVVTVVEVGATRAEIVRLAEDRHVDLIVIGRHSRHGILRLLGSTAQAVLHHACCDVLAVNLIEQSQGTQ